jgi:hypothetical protein
MGGCALEHLQQPVPQVRSSRGHLRRPHRLQVRRTGGEGDHQGVVFEGEDYCREGVIERPEQDLSTGHTPPTDQHQEGDQPEASHGLLPPPPRLAAPDRGVGSSRGSGSAARWSAGRANRRRGPSTPSWSRCVDPPSVSAATSGARRAAGVVPPDGRDLLRCQLHGLRGLPQRHVSPVHRCRLPGCP